LLEITRVVIIGNVKANDKVAAFIGWGHLDQQNQFVAILQVVTPLSHDRAIFDVRMDG
jgi:hypothetical protein